MLLFTLASSMGRRLVTPLTLVCSSWRALLLVPPDSIVVIIVIMVSLLLIIVVVVMVPLLIALVLIPLILVPPSATTAAPLVSAPTLVSAPAPAATSTASTALEPASSSVIITSPVHLRAVLVHILVECVGPVCLLIEEFFCFVCIEVTTVWVEEATLPIVAVLLVPIDGAFSAAIIAIIISAVTPATSASRVMPASLAAFIPAVITITVPVLPFAAMFVFAILPFLVLEMEVPITLELVGYFHRVHGVIGIERVDVLFIG